MDLEFLRQLAQPSPGKIVFFILDGLGGLPLPETGRTELETASTPNLDRLARVSTCGLSEPVGPGITPGSAPAHLALFGYDPLKYQIGRGVLEALGIDFDLKAGDVAARGNFCLVDSEGKVLDRRAGRLANEKAAELCHLLNQVRLDSVQLFVSHVREHRFVAIFRGQGLSNELSDSDPQKVGVTPREVTPLSERARRTAALANRFVAEARRLLSHHPEANMVLLRGFSQLPYLPQMGEVLPLKPAAIASYPMYRGLAKLLGMEVLSTGSTLQEEIDTLCRRYENYNFFYLHFKKTDAAGEDGNFQAKVQAIAEVDQLLPQILSLKPEVLVVTGDHSTPALLKGHSWHPVPFLLYSPWCRPDGLEAFSESACARGSLGRFPALQAMPLALAHALKLTKYGA